VDELERLHRRGPHRLHVLVGFGGCADDHRLLTAEAGHLAALSNRRGLVLITSRTVDPEVWGREARVVPLPPLSNGTAGQILLDQLPSRPTPAQRASAEAVAKRLGRLPLALFLAGRYLGSGLSELDLNKYLRVLERESVRFVDLPARAGLILDGADPGRQVFTTWEISLAALEAAGNTRARRVLRFLSMFAGGQPIPVALTDWTVLHSSGLIDEPAEQADHVVLAALTGLRSVGLLQTATGPAAALVVHPLVSEVSLLRIAVEGEDPATLLTGAAVALRRRCDQLDLGEPAHWPDWQLLVPHATALLGRLDDRTEPARAAVLHAVSPVIRHRLNADLDLALVQLDCGDFRAAESRLRQILAERITESGEKTRLHSPPSIIWGSRCTPTAASTMRGAHFRRFCTGGPHTSARRIPTRSPPGSASP
jgi:hypothetical protein